MLRLKKGGKEGSEVVVFNHLQNVVKMVLPFPFFLPFIFRRRSDQKNLHLRISGKETLIEK